MVLLVTLLTAAMGCIALKHRLERYVVKELSPTVAAQRARFVSFTHLRLEDVEAFGMKAPVVDVVWSANAAVHFVRESVAHYVGLGGDKPPSFPPLHLRVNEGLFHESPIAAQLEITPHTDGYRIRGTGNGPDDSTFSIDGFGRRHTDEALDLTLDANGVPVLDALRWAGVDVLEGSVAGQLFGAVRFVHDGNVLQVLGQGSIEDAWIGDAALDGGVFDFEMGGGRSRISIDIAVGDGRVWTREIVVDSHGVQGEIVLEALPVPTLMRAIGDIGDHYPAIHRLGGRLNGTISLERPDQGTRPGAGDVQVRYHLHSERLTYQGRSLAPFVAEGLWGRETGLELQQLAVRSLVATGVVRDLRDFLIEVRWLGDEGTEGLLTVEGAADGTMARLDRFPTAPLSMVGVFPPLEGDVSGDIEVRTGEAGWTVVGALSTPRMTHEGYGLSEATLNIDLATREPSPECTGCVWGVASLQGGLITKGGDGAPLDVHLLFDGRQARLDGLHLGLWGGRVWADGQAILDDEGWRLDFTLGGDKLRYEDSGVELLMAYDAHLGGTWSAPRLQGTLRTIEGEIDLFALTSDRSTPLDPIGGVVGPMGRLVVEVDIEVRAVDVMARSLFETEVSGDLQIKGNALQPGVYGELNARRGIFRLGRTRFDIAEASARFQGPALKPIVNARGGARVTGSHVEVHVFGEAGDITTNLLVDGRADQQEAMRLLGMATTGADAVRDWSELGQALWGWLNAQLISEASWQLSRAVEQSFDLDRFRLESAADDGIQLSVGKYLTSDLYVNYRRSLTDPDRQDVGVEYTPAPGLRIHSEWKSTEGSDIGLEWTFPF